MNCDAPLPVLKLYVVDQGSLCDLSFTTAEILDREEYVPAHDSRQPRRGDVGEPDLPHPVVDPVGG